MLLSRNAQNSFGRPQWNYLILMPENFGSGPVLIWWIKLLRSSASELTNNYSKPLNLLCEGCQGCPWSPFSSCFVCRAFYGRGGKKKERKETGATRNWNLSLRQSGKRNLTFTRLFWVPWQTPLPWYCFSDIWRQKHMLPVTGDFILKYHNKAIKIKNTYSLPLCTRAARLWLKCHRSKYFLF